jgi:two-component sensor histidine kinase
MSQDRRKKIILEIKDTGVGFPEEMDHRESDTLGMQLVNDLVKQLQGTIALDKKGGTNWKISF